MRLKAQERGSAPHEFERARDGCVRKAEPASLVITLTVRGWVDIRSSCPVFRLTLVLPTASSSNGDLYFTVRLVGLVHP